MIPSNRVCGTCGTPLSKKVFRDADIFVCGPCHSVTLNKADFKSLLLSRTAEASIGGAENPAPIGHSGPSMSPIYTHGLPVSAEPELGIQLTDETEEYTSAPLPTVAPTEVAMEPTFELLGGTDDHLPDPIGALQLDIDAFDEELEAYQQRKRKRSMLIASGVVAVVLVLLLFVGAAAVFGWVASGESTSVATEPALVKPVSKEALPPKAPTPRAAAPVQPVPPPAPVVPQPVAAPTPKPKPRPAPARAAPKEESVGSLARRGWAAFDRSASEAEGLFQKALARSPNHADANYGYGYVLLKQGRSSEAIPYLCRAKQRGDAEISRDIRAILTKNNLSCP